MPTVLARIRPAVMLDSPGIRRIRNAAIRDSLAIWTSREQTQQEAAAWLKPQVERGTALVAVAGSSGGDRAEEQVLGFAVASPWRDYEGYARTVEDSVYLSPNAQGCGLGSRLLGALIKASRQAGDRTMVAAIEAGNSASVRLHERHGFTLVGALPRAGEKQGRILDLVLMSLDLLLAAKDRCTVQDVAREHQAGPGG